MSEATPPRPTLANLSTEQRSRADALLAARHVLSGVTSRAATPDVDVVDVVSLARFILTGEDPFDAATAGLCDQPDCQLSRGHEGPHVGWAAGGFIGHVSPGERRLAVVSAASGTTLGTLCPVSGCVLRDGHEGDHSTGRDQP